jgi:hypothetical protein
MSNSEKPEIPQIAFAVGGLGGNNAFGAGFLQAALDKDIQPGMITCTSGQILWVSKYIEAFSARKSVPPGDCLRKEMETFIEGTEPFHDHDLDLWHMGFYGKEGMMRTAFPELILDTMKNTISAFERVLQQGRKAFLTRELLSEWPVRWLVPRFSDEFFSKISDVFNSCDKIGIAFNSYDPAEGMEIVHLNPLAKRLLQKEAGEKSSHRSRTLYKDITPQYVRNGLWLFQYGFEDCSIIDGCYFRGVMLSEAAVAREVFVSRPINYKWIGKLPTNYIENEDLKTEIYFNGSYQGERDKIMLVNNMLGPNLGKCGSETALPDADEGKNEPESGLPNGKEGKSGPEGVLQKYHEVTLCEVEMDTQRGFFDYIFEDIEVFDQSRQRSAATFDKCGAATP